MMRWRGCSRRRLVIVPYVQNGRPGIVSRAEVKSWVQSRALRHRWLRPVDPWERCPRVSNNARQRWLAPAASPLCFGCHGALVGASAAISAAKLTMLMRILRAAPSPERRSLRAISSTGLKSTKNFFWFGPLELWCVSSLAARPTTLATMTEAALLAHHFVFWTESYEALRLVLQVEVSVAVGRVESLSGNIRVCRSVAQFTWFQFMDYAHMYWS